jgi:hypothetical protein
MAKLPQLKTTPVPEHQKRRLLDWFQERHIRLIPCDAENFCPEKSAQSEEKERGSHFKELVSAYDTNVKVGQVRLLSPQLIASRMAHVLVLSEWTVDEKGNKTFLVVPFGEYSVAATQGELETNSSNNMMKVLQCWLARTVNQEKLELSWILKEEMDQHTMKEAKLVWKSSTFGREIPEELQEKIGCRIAREDDPRIQYQEEELRLWANFSSLT